MFRAPAAPASVGSFWFNLSRGCMLMLGVGGWLASLPAHALTELDGVGKVAAGNFHTCALTTAGGVKCWGYNSNGQLGDGTTTHRSTPVDVTGLASGVAAIAAGGNHTCALTTSGGVKCWGYNFTGQLGDNSTTQSLVPVDVSGLASGVTAITAGDQATCALTTAGGAKCWGYNGNGQLGDGTTTHRSTPVNVSGLASGVAAISGGGSHTCALTAAGSVQCWGYNNSGQIGDNSTTQRLTPVGVSGLASGVAEISAGGFHTCALTTGGGAKCWGNNVYGQIGIGTTTQRLTPADVSGLASGVTAITAGSYHSCALTTGGGAKCWGDNQFGQVGDNSTTQRLTPVNVSGLASGVAAATAGSYHSCALTSGGGVKCWGFNLYGQIGDGTTTGRLTPVAVLAVPADFAGNVRVVVTSYYETILGRAPDQGGLDFWVAEATRVVNLGADVREVFFAMSIEFFASTEYVNRSTSDTQFLTDMYRTFFGREPDAGGLTYWQGELTATGSRSALLNSFLFSPEFSNTMTARFGSSTVRPEVNMTIDLYRGILGRLPDSGGFVFWLGEIRKAQCQGASAVSSAVTNLATSFFTSGEYAARARNDRDFMGDVYSAYLRRGPGGDTGGYNYWVGRIPVVGRNSVRSNFVPSAEFQNRVSAVIAAGCFGG